MKKLRSDAGYGMRDARYAMRGKKLSWIAYLESRIPYLVS